MAVAARWQGMLPVFTSLSRQRSDIARLEDELIHAQRDKAHAENVAHHAIEASERAMPALNKAKEELAQAQYGLETLKKEMQEKTEVHRAEMEKQRDVVRRLHTQLQALKAQVSSRALPSPTELFP